MTVRDHLRSKIKKAYIVGFTGWLLLAGSIVLAPKASPVTVAIPGLTLFFGAVIYTLLAVRCPRCRNRLGQTLTAGSGVPFSRSKVRFCPFCGLELDSQDVQERSAV